MGVHFVRFREDLGGFHQLHEFSKSAMEQMPEKQQLQYVENPHILIVDGVSPASGPHVLVKLYLEFYILAFGGELAPWPMVTGTWIFNLQKEAIENICDF